MEQVSRAIDKYTQHAKGYVPLFFNPLLEFEAENSAANKAANKALKRRYDVDPRVFWNQSTIKAEFPDFPITFSIFIFSLLSSSASCGRIFNRMGWMVSGR